MVSHMFSSPTVSGIRAVYRRNAN